MRLKLTLVTGILAWISVLAPSICSAEVQRQEFRVVGTWSYLDHWKKREEPFWRERVPSLSDGKLTAKVKSLTDLGISGFEIMRLLKKGAYDVVHGMTNYVAQESPVIEGVDLAGVGYFCEGVGLGICMGREYSRGRGSCGVAVWVAKKR